MCFVSCFVLSSSIVARSHLELCFAGEINGNFVCRFYFFFFHAGAIQHIAGFFIWAKVPDRVANNGLIVVRGRSVRSATANAAAAASALTGTSATSPVAAMGPPRSKADSFVGKQVRVKKGIYKSLVGIVRDETDTTCRVELHSSLKIVSIARVDLAIFVSDAAARPSSSSSTSFYSGAQTPRHESTFSGQTPAPHSAVGSRTPSWGSKTPMLSHSEHPSMLHPSSLHGSYTPSHFDAFGPYTPAHGLDKTGSATPRGAAHDDDEWSSSAAPFGAMDPTASMADRIAQQQRAAASQPPAGSATPRAAAARTAAAATPTAAPAAPTTSPADNVLVVGLVCVDGRGRSGSVTSIIDATLCRFRVGSAEVRCCVGVVAGFMSRYHTRLVCH